MVVVAEVSAHPSTAMQIWRRRRFRWSEFVRWGRQPGKAPALDKHSRERSEAEQ